MGTTVPQGPLSVLLAGGHVGIDPASPYIDPSIYKVNVPGVFEQITQPLYSYQLYPAAGTSTLSFFQNPAGATGVTTQDTNMTLAGQLPAPQMFLIQGIGIDYLPGGTAASPAVGPVADASTGWVNDFFAIFREGVFSLTIGSKNYFQMQPLLALPPRSHLDGSFAVATNLTIGAATQTRFNVAWSEGDVFLPTPILLEAGQNFVANITWPLGGIATISTDALARIGVIFYGTLFRPAQ